MRQSIFYTLLTIGPFEDEADFRDLLANAARRGMFVYGLLGVGIIILFVTLHLTLGGRIPTFTYSNINTDRYLTLTDKSLIFLVCLIAAYLSRKSLSLNVCRAIVFGMVWMICMAMLLDDIAVGDVSFSTAYISIALILAVGTIPYKGWQMGLLVTTVIASMLLAVNWLPALLTGESLYFSMSQTIYLFLITMVLTGLSSQLYLGRYRQYVARREAETLSKKLEERAYVLKQLKEKSEQQAQQLLDNEKLKDRFFANISHELRTPLTLLLGPLKDMLGEARSDNDASGTSRVESTMVRLMYRNAQRLLGLINQLLDLSRIDAGELEVKKEPVNLAEAVPEVVHSFLSYAETKQVALHCSVEMETAVCRFDIRQLEELIGNLLSNAIKFTPAGGQVKVALKRDPASERSLQLTVRDTGVGIPEEDLTHVFDRFYQVSGQADQGNIGTGIGLALVKEIVELHDGDIRLDSSVGKGSIFTIELFEDDAVEGKPITSVAAEGREWLLDEPGDYEPDISASENKDAPKVLVVDDNPDMVAYLRSILSERYSVFPHTDSKEVLHALQEQPVDLIISDVMMPEPDGFSLCQKIKEDAGLSHIPVILLTARVEEESRIEGLQLGADDYISKPFSPSELTARVENLIELRRFLRRKYSREVRLEGSEVEVSSEDARFLQEVQAAIEKHIGDANFTVDWLADEVHLSSRQLQRKVRAITDLSAGGYIRLMRLERASQLLEQHWGNVSEVAYAVGFQDAKYFSRLFKQMFEVSPSEYGD